jgi:acetyl-CoA acetyltransferase
MIAKQYMHLSGATSRDFGAISVADRKHAAKNPKAYFYEKPITIEDHQNSR